MCIYTQSTRKHRAYGLTMHINLCENHNLVHNTIQDIIKLYAHAKQINRILNKSSLILRESK